MATLQPVGSAVRRRRPQRARHLILWLRRRQALVLAVAIAGIVASFLLDLAIPGYAVAGLYLIPLMLVAFTVRGRVAAVVVGLCCLALTVTVMVLQGRADAQNVLLVVFGALAGAGLIALGYLYNRYDRLYETERSTTGRLQLLTAQLKGLQELSALSAERPLVDLLQHIVVLARQLLDSDGSALFRHDAVGDLLRLEAAIGLPLEGTAAGGYPIEGDPPGRAVREQRVVVVPNAAALQGPTGGGDVDEGREGRGSAGEGTACGDAGAVVEARRRGVEASAGRLGLFDGEASDWRACLALPLVAGEDLYGALALYFRQPTSFTEQDIGLAQSFCDQAALAIANTRLRERLEQSAVAAERSRLARDLHDSLTQSLFAARLKAETLLQRWPPTSPEARENLEDIHRLTRGALAEMRALLLEMRPAALAQSSLDGLLRHLVEATRARTRISLEASFSGGRPLPPDVTVALYRIAQEALNNVVRHSGARRAVLSLRQSDGEVELSLTDDGRGFELSGVGAEQFGLTIMRERAEAVGASLRVATRTGCGTTVTLTWNEGQG
jgi:signal transduction histidine kinase